MGAKGKRIRASVLDFLGSCPGMTTCDLCRKLNGVDPQDITYCNLFSCYANSRKRAAGRVSKCQCGYSLQLLRYHLKKLVTEGLLFFEKELRTDHLQNRGYDLYTCYYPA